MGLESGACCWRCERQPQMSVPGSVVEEARTRVITMQGECDSLRGEMAGLKQALADMAGMQASMTQTMNF